MINLKASPFNLSNEDIDWVMNTLSSMTLTEKIGQIFCPVGFTTDEAVLKQLVQGIGIGGIMYRSAPGQEVQKTHRMLQEYSKIPMLLAANLESGGTGLVTDGTSFGMPMQASAANDDQMGYYLGKISCSEAAAAGCNWAFAPIVDIDMNFRNPITNLRTFGSDPDKVISMAKGYMRAADEEGVAVSIKHFPGDGVDERDQHLLTSINTLSADEWDATCGKVYASLIESGAKTIMVGHIAQPAWVHKLNPKIPERNVVPATLSPEIIGGLLRGRLGFKGVITTDATPMVGYCVGMKREDAVPYSIAIGCDVFLFNKSIEEDFRFMMAGYQKGILTDDRLNEAVTRILALKASLKLHIKQKNGTLVPGPEALSILRNPKHIEWSRDCADKSVTLVKDLQNLLPISPEKTKRVYLNVIEENDDLNSPLRIKLKEKLEKEGFEVTVRNRSVNIDVAALMNGEEVDDHTREIIAEAFSGTGEFAKKYDLVIYFANIQTNSNTTVIRLNWKGFGGMGNDTPWFTQELPVLFISLANPYHLLDVPMIKTYINAYSSNDFVLDSVIEKITGRSEFKGKSPVDPFCGRWDTML